MPRILRKGKIPNWRPAIGIHCQAPLSCVAGAHVLHALHLGWVITTDVGLESFGAGITPFWRHRFNDEPCDGKAARLRPKRSD